MMSVKISLFILIAWQSLKVTGHVLHSNEDNQLTSLPLDIPYNVTALNLTQNNLTQLMDGYLDKFTDLQLINLTSNKIKTVANGSFNPVIHKDLEMIYIGNNLITSLPILDGFGMLRILNVSQNKLETITLGRLENLTELFLLDNNLNVMPVLIHLLPSLEILDLFNNSISNIPGGYFENVPALKAINMGESSLFAFDCSGLFQLQYLYLDKTKVHEFPNITDCFPSLITLKMQSNYNKLITAGIAEALVFGSTLIPKVSNSLLNVYFRNTYIGDLPSWFLFALPNLETLDIAKTSSTEIPDISTNFK